MATVQYLAMRSEEYHTYVQPPGGLGWLDCRFSQSGPGLDGLPSVLPPGSLLILTDQIPLGNHDHDLISEQLGRTVDSLGCSGVLLDFERPEENGLNRLAALLVSSLPCPVVVSDIYAQTIDCPVFLSPCPHHVPFSDHMAPWMGREIWLDLAKDAEMITVTAAGSSVTPLSSDSIFSEGFRDERLHCHYSISCQEDHVQFSLWRTAHDLDSLVREAEGLGIHTFVSLCQELK